MAATMSASNGDGEIPAPSFADAAGQERVFEALFGQPSQPRRIGRYAILGTLGQGGMGAVLEAFDRTLDRRVALKVLHDELSHKHTQRLMREAQALAKLSHPNVVQVYEVGEAEGRGFIAMELVQGRSLDRWLRDEPRPDWRECVRVHVQAGEGLAAAHERGLIHRDFKPGNAVIDDKGRVRVLDFGLARQAEDDEDTEMVGAVVDDEDEASALDTPLTKTGAVLGTPAYMPIEQMQGKPADTRSDQFSFCVSLYEALYDERPFAGNTMAALAVSMLGNSVRPAPKGTKVPEALRKIVLRGLAAEPDDRWPSMEALLVQLRRRVTPRGRRWWAVGLAGGLTALGVGIGQYAQVGFRCEGAEARLAGVWDESRRAEVEAAILSIEVPYAADTWERVQARLDDYGEAWAKKHTSICEATNVHQAQSEEVMDLRMDCLRRRRLAVQGAVDVLAKANETRVRRAVTLVANLPRLSRCDDVEALRAELPPPEDPTAARRVGAARERLVLVQSLEKAGEYDEALEIAEALEEEAEAVEYAPLFAEVLLELGNLRRIEGDYVAAEATLERAYLIAAEQGHDVVEARAVSWLAAVVGYGLTRHMEGLQWGKTALALAGGPRVGPRALGHVLNNIAIIYISKEDLDRALDHLRRAVAADEEALGPEHPDLARPLNNMGNALVARGRYDEAFEIYQRALHIREQALGPSHPDNAGTLANLGSVLEHRGEDEAALDHLARALAIFEDNLPPKHPRVAITLTLMGTVLSSLGKDQQALDYFQRVVDMDGDGGPGPLPIGSALQNMGSIARTRGQLDEAIRLHQRALRAFEAAAGPDSAHVAHPLVSMAGVALDQGDLETARGHAERAIAILEESETDREQLAAARFILARVVAVAPEELPRARRLAERARDGFAELGAGLADELAEVEAWLVANPSP